MTRFYDQIEASVIDADDFTVHGLHLAPQKMTTLAVRPGANIYPIVLRANAAGKLIATSECFANAAWKSVASVIVPPTAQQRAVLGTPIKSELQGLASQGNTYAFTADLQPLANLNTNAITQDATPFSVQLAVSNCSQACNVFITLGL